MTRNAVCFGEVLLDLFPDEERIGGAPLNVASRLSAMGFRSSIISRIGKDGNGRKLLEYLEKNRVNLDTVQEDALLPTGTVIVKLDATGAATYDIASPAAWDHIEPSAQALSAVEASAAFIYGSLACRSEKSRETLFQLLPKARFRILDLNLRPPHYSAPLLLELMQCADLIKFNEEEILEIAEMLGLAASGLEVRMQLVAEWTGAGHICVTKGAEGAVFLYNGNFYRSAGYPVQVRDTVGAGDSFLASLIAKLLGDSDPQQALEYACAVGAMVAGETGANPAFSEQQVADFMKR